MGYNPEGIYIDTNPSSIEAHGPHLDHKINITSEVGEGLPLGKTGSITLEQRFDHNGNLLHDQSNVRVKGHKMKQVFPFAPPEPGPSGPIEIPVPKWDGNCP